MAESLELLAAGIIGPDWVAAAFYPNRYPGSLEVRARNFDRLWYHRDFSRGQLARIPRRGYTGRPSLSGRGACRADHGGTFRVRPSRTIERSQWRSA